MNTVLLCAMTLTVTLLVRAELRGNRGQILVFKPLSTVLVIVLACVACMAEPGRYAYWIVAGLVLSLGGDVALIFRERPSAFRAGIVLFLLAHVAYIVAFWPIGRWATADIAAGAILLAIAGALYAKFYRGLGPLKVAVVVYMLVISLMMSRAFAVWCGTDAGAAEGVLVLTGAALFYLSDIVLAWNRFVSRWRWERLSLIAYYGGQAMIALSIGA